MSSISPNPSNSSAYAGTGGYVSTGEKRESPNKQASTSDQTEPPSNNILAQVALGAINNEQLDVYQTGAGAISHAGGSVQSDARPLTGPGDRGRGTDLGLGGGRPGDPVGEAVQGLVNRFNQPIARAKIGPAGPDAHPLTGPGDRGPGTDLGVGGGRPGDPLQKLDAHPLTGPGGPVDQAYTSRAETVSGKVNETINTLEAKADNVEEKVNDAKKIIDFTNNEDQVPDALKNLENMADAVEERDKQALLESTKSLIGDATKNVSKKVDDKVDAKLTETNEKTEILEDVIVATGHVDEVPDAAIRLEDLADAARNDDPTELGEGDSGYESREQIG